MQDPCYQVRDEFLRKYISFATHQQLPAHFNVIPFLTVHDPEADIRNMVRAHPLPFTQSLINYLQAKAYVSLAYRASPPGFFFEHLTVECADHCPAPGAKMNYFEMIFVQFLHLLAHHPDFSLSQESLPDMAKYVYLLRFSMPSSYVIFGTRYIEFYLESVASAENISLLYHLSGKAKTVRDSESHLYSEVR